MGVEGRAAVGNHTIILKSYSIAKNNSYLRQLMMTMRRRKTILLKMTHIPHSHTKNNNYLISVAFVTVSAPALFLKVNEPLYLPLMENWYRNNNDNELVTCGSRRSYLMPQSSGRLKTRVFFI